MASEQGTALPHLCTKVRSIMSNIGAWRITIEVVGEGHEVKANEQEKAEEIEKEMERKLLEVLDRVCQELPSRVYVDEFCKGDISRTHRVIGVTSIGSLVDITVSVSLRSHSFVDNIDVVEPEVTCIILTTSGTDVVRLLHTILSAMKEKFGKVWLKKFGDSIDELTHAIENIPVPGEY